jgi:hypothetical protein
MANPDYEFIEGGDKYGPPGTDFQYMPTSIWADEWTNIYIGGFGSTARIAAPINGVIPGHGSIQLLDSNSGNNQSGMIKNLPGNYARTIGGLTLKVTDGYSVPYIQFRDGNSIHITLAFDWSVGRIKVYRGNFVTLLATTTQILGAATAHVVEWDITFNAASGIVKIWIDGLLSSINITGQNTVVTANNYCNDFVITSGQANGHQFNFDHLYTWWWLAAGGSELPCLTNPIIETASPNSDGAAINWTINDHAFLTPAYYFGSAATGNSPGSNIIYLRRMVPDQNGDITGVTISKVNTTSASVKNKALIYSDVGGNPSALLGTGTEVIGTNNGNPLYLPISVIGVTAGLPYWVGFITDTNINYGCNDDGGISYVKGNTYTAGPPSPAGTGYTTNSPNMNFIISMTGVTAHYAEQNAPSSILKDLSYSFSSTIGQRELVAFPALVTTPQTIHSVAIKAMQSRSDSGVRATKILCKSGASISYGSNGDTAPSLTWALEASNFKIDPATGVPWTAAGLAAANFGVEVTL